MPVDAQLDQLRGAGCAKIYREKVTGARADRRIQFRQRKQDCSWISSTQRGTIRCSNIQQTPYRLAVKTARKGASIWHVWVLGTYRWHNWPAFAEAIREP